MINEKPKDVVVITTMDTLLIAAPLFILFLILSFDGQPRAIFNKPEWSFVTVFYLIEVLRNQVSRYKIEGYAIEQAEAGTAFYSIVLVVGVLILAADYKYSIGNSPLTESEIYLLKFSAFFISLALFCWSRFRRYKLCDIK